MGIRCAAGETLPPNLRPPSLRAVIAAHRALPPPHDLHWTVTAALLDIVAESRRLRAESRALVVAIVIANLVAAARWALASGAPATDGTVAAWLVVVLASLLAGARLAWIARRRRHLGRFVHDLMATLRRLERLVGGPLPGR